MPAGARSSRRSWRGGSAVEAGDLVPQTVAWTMLGVALAAYEHWLADESVPLQALGGAFDVVGQASNDAFDTASDGLGALT